MFKTFTDQMGQSVKVPFPPQRIVSLVPSQTELLFDLGLEDKVVGRTKFCIHPKPKLKEVSIIGGTKKINLEKIKALQPDLIIGNKEENSEEDILKLQKEFPVWMSDIFTLNEALNMILSIGEICNVKRRSLEIVNKIENDFASLNPFKGERVIYLIWKKPYMGVASNAFIHDILLKLGLKNALDSYSRYPELSEEEIVSLNPDVIFLSSEPYPFNEIDKSYFKNLVPKSKVEIVNGEYFSWYGSRLLQAKPYFDKLVQSIY